MKILLKEKDQAEEKSVNLKEILWQINWILDCLYINYFPFQQLEMIQSDRFLFLTYFRDYIWLPKSF